MEKRPEALSSAEEQPLPGSGAQMASIVVKALVVARVFCPELTVPVWESMMVAVVGLEQSCLRQKPLQVLLRDLVRN
jgi:hypothetical protein